MRGRTVGRVGFPTVPDPSWSAAARARWDTARAIADSAGGVVDRFGWQVETEPIPGMGRTALVWAVAFALVVPGVFGLAPWLGLHIAMYVTAAVGSGLLVAGGVLALRADTANHPPTPEQVAAFNAAHAAHTAAGGGEVVPIGAGRAGRSCPVRLPEVAPSGQARVGGRG